MPRRHYRISGRVQGVWYRQSTVEAAQRLGVAGWVRNLPDGSVEAVAEGDTDSLDRLEKWMWEGPRLAEVTGVVVEDADDGEEMTGFRTRY